MDRRVIGRGRTADILAWGDSRAMKLYLEGKRRDYVRREAEVSRLVHRAGLPAPAVYDAETEDGLFEVDGRLGILYERIDGPTMLRELARRPWMIFLFAKGFASLHARIHLASVEGLPRMRDRLERAVEQGDGFLPEGLKQRIRYRLDSLPDEERVCHGDFHPDNVLIGKRGLLVIDWGPASLGHPLADVAWTVLLLRFADVPPGTPRLVRLIGSALRRLFLRIYLKAYFALTDRRKEELSPWLGVVAVLRLGDDISEERSRLLALIEREFGDGG